jgi:hypothetical protein
VDISPSFHDLSFFFTFVSATTLFRFDFGIAAVESYPCCSRRPEID